MSPAPQEEETVGAAWLLLPLLAIALLALLVLAAVVLSGAA